MPKWSAGSLRSQRCHPAVAVAATGPLRLPRAHPAAVTRPAPVSIILASVSTACVHFLHHRRLLEGMYTATSIAATFHPDLLGSARVPPLTFGRRSVQRDNINPRSSRHGQQQLRLDLKELLDGAKTSTQCRRVQRCRPSSERLYDGCQHPSLP